MKTKKFLTLAAVVVLLLLGGLLIRAFASTAKPIGILSRGCPPCPPPEPATTFTSAAVISQDIFASGGTVTADGRLAAPVGTPIRYTIVYHPGGYASVTLPPQVDLCVFNQPFPCTPAPSIRTFSVEGSCIFNLSFQLFEDGKPVFVGPCGTQINDQTSYFEFIAVVVGKPGEFFQLTVAAPDGTAVQSAPITVVQDTPGPPA